MADSSFQQIRPFKVLALLMVCLAIILTIISIAGPDWVSVTFYGGEVKSWGLWWRCYKIHRSFELCIDEAWLAACASLLLISLLMDILIGIMAVCGLLSKQRRYYVVAGWLCVLSLVIQAISLIVYRVMFAKDVRNNEEYNAETSKFVFDWTYGLAWGAVCFLLGSAIFFFIRVKEEEETQPMKSARGHEMPPNYYRA